MPPAAGAEKAQRRADSNPFRPWRANQLHSRGGDADADASAVADAVAGAVAGASAVNLKV